MNVGVLERALVMPAHKLNATPSERPTQRHLTRFVSPNGSLARLFVRLAPSPDPQNVHRFQATKTSGANSKKSDTTKYP